MKTTTLLIKDTHRGLRYADGIMQEVLGPGFYEVRRPSVARVDDARTNPH